MSNEMDEVISGLKQLREVAEKSGTMSAESKAHIEKIGEEVSKKHEAIQAKQIETEAAIKKQESEIESLKSDYADLYKKSMRMKATGDVEKTAQMKHAAAFSKYLRKGVTPSSDALNEIAREFVIKSIDENDESAVAHHVRSMVEEQGPESGKGFYVFPEVKNQLVAGSNPDGGYYTLPDRRTDIVVSRFFETSPMRAISQVITTGTDSVEIPIDDNIGVSGGWVGELGPISQTNTPQLGLLKITVHEQYAQPQMTQKLLDDAYVNVEEWLARKTNDEIIRTENTAFVAGTGSQQPKGFLSYAAWSSAGVYERGKLERVLSGSGGNFTADGLRKLQGSLLEEYQSKAVFLTQRSSFTLISLLKDGTGRYLLNEQLLSNGVDVRLLGKPMIYASDMQAAAQDSLSIAYGDFSTSYTIVDRMGLRVLRDPYTSKPFIKFYTTKRVGGDVTNYQALKIGQLT